jgi:hypothetical protein
MSALHRFNHPNGKKSSVWNAEDVGIDAGKKKYIASCDNHGTFVGASSQRDAIISANNTDNFCDDCREELLGKA